MNDVVCPKCKATKDQKGRPFTKKTLSGHMGGAHPGSKKVRARRTFAEARPAKRAAKYARYKTKGLRSGMATVMPYRKGEYLILVDGIAQPFLSYATNLQIVGPIEEE